MVIKFETVPAQNDSGVGSNSSELMTTTHIYERGDYRNRDAVLVKCFEAATRFYAHHFQSATLILLNVKLEDTKMNRYLGVWKVLEKQFKLKIPDGKRSEEMTLKNGNLNFVCKVEVAVEQFAAALQVLIKFRNSMLVFGDSLESNKFLDQAFETIENIDASNPHSWISLATYLTKQNLIALRCFGMFDDVENGVIVYEPHTFFKVNGDWKKR
jgi:hypothetical protein